MCAFRHSQKGMTLILSRGANSPSLFARSFSGGGGSCSRQGESVAPDLLHLLASVGRSAVPSICKVSDLSDRSVQSTGLCFTALHGISSSAVLRIGLVQQLSPLSIGGV